ncbi:hypothetical protein [Azospirillum endophyticum]
MADSSTRTDGGFFLALWNDVDGDKRREYDLWHTVEHVPERVSIPGILAARRYVTTGAPLHDYFTLYEIESLAVLAAAPYRGVVDRPTRWTSAMRPFLRNFLRQPCRCLLRMGAGLGGAAATIRFGVPDEGRVATLIETLESHLSSQPAFVAARLGSVVPDPTFLLPNMPSHAPEAAASFVLVLEGLPSPGWRAVVDETAGWLARAGVPVVAVQDYDLAFVVDERQVDPLLWRNGRPASDPNP